MRSILIKCYGEGGVYSLHTGHGGERAEDQQGYNRPPCVYQQLRGQRLPAHKTPI